MKFRGSFFFGIFSPAIVVHFNICFPFCFIFVPTSFVIDSFSYFVYFYFSVSPCLLKILFPYFFLHIFSCLFTLFFYVFLLLLTFFPVFLMVHFLSYVAFPSLFLHLLFFSFFFFGDKLRRKSILYHFAWDETLMFSSRRLADAATPASTPPMLTSSWAARCWRWGSRARPPLTTCTTPSSRPPTRPSAATSYLTATPTRRRPAAATRPTPRPCPWTTLSWPTTATTLGTSWPSARSWRALIPLLDQKIDNLSFFVQRDPSSCFFFFFSQIGQPVNRFVLRTLCHDKRSFSWRYFNRDINSLTWFEMHKLGTKNQNMGIDALIIL